MCTARLLPRVPAVNSQTDWGVERYMLVNFTFAAQNLMGVTVVLGLYGAVAPVFGACCGVPGAGSDYEPNGTR